MDDTFQDQLAHTTLPVWQQTQRIGYDVCGINGCILADRHLGSCVFPPPAGPRRRRSAEEVAQANRPPGDWAGPSAKKKRKSTKASPPKSTAKPKDPRAKATAPAAQPAAAASAPAPALKPDPPQQQVAAAAAAEEGPDANKEEDDAACKKCGRRDGAMRMLLCDGEACNNAYHTFCLTPPLLAAPKGEWFCPHCELKRQVRSNHFQHAGSLPRRCLPIRIPTPRPAHPTSCHQPRASSHSHAPPVSPPSCRLRRGCQAASSSVTSSFWPRKRRNPPLRLPPVPTRAATRRSTLRLVVALTLRLQSQRPRPLPQRAVSGRPCRPYRASRRRARRPSSAAGKKRRRRSRVPPGPPSPLWRDPERVPNRRPPKVRRSRSRAAKRPPRSLSAYALCRSCWRQPR